MGRLVDDRGGIFRPIAVGISSRHVEQLNAVVRVVIMAKHAGWHGGAVGSGCLVVVVAVAVDDGYEWKLRFDRMKTADAEVSEARAVEILEAVGPIAVT